VVVVAGGFLVGPGGAGPSGRVDVLDIFTLGQGALVAAQPTLGEFVNALVGRRSPGLDHIEDATLVRTQPHHLAGNGAAQGDAFAQFLFFKNKKIVKR
jgi:hypothetical protein